MNAGHVYIAPDGIRAYGGARRAEGEPRPGRPQEHGLRPAVSYLFRSAARCLQERGRGHFSFTGMGTDGAEELKALRDLGGWTFAQDSESCVVFGVPG